MTNQNATKQFKGYIYQLYFAIYQSITLEEDYFLSIEENGDVSIENVKNVEIQYEIKYHGESNTLNLYSLDFWKTLNNWLLIYEKIKDAKELILITTSSINKECDLYDWNSKESEKKYKILYNFYKEDIKREKISIERKKYFDKIFNESNTTKVKKILDIFRINNNDKSFNDLRKKTFELKEFKFFDNELKENIFEKMLYLIINTPCEKKDTKWEISYDKVCGAIKEINNNGGISRVKMSFPIIDNIKEEDKNNLMDRKFVKEIANIDYEEQINDAIIDYISTNISINNSLRKSITFQSEYEIYKDNLTRKLINLKRNTNLKFDDKSIIKRSKIFYNDSVNESCENIIIESLNVKNGIRHHLVDEGRFTWKMEE